MTDPSESSVRRRRKVLVVLPAFNEEPKIGTLLERIDEAMFEGAQEFEVVVVDDGSSDKTAEIVLQKAERMPITLLQHPQNLGLGTTIRDGLVAASERAHGRDIVVTMDADDTHTPGLILRMVRMLNEGFDVVIASRYQRGSRSFGVPLSRRVLSYGASLLFRLVLPTAGVRDFTCGYRAYRAEVLQAALSHYGDEFLDQDGFQCMVDILLKLRKMNIIFGEVPFVLRYDLKEGDTKMDISSTIGLTLRLMLKARFSR